MLYNTAFRMTALAGVLSLALSACGGSGGNTVTKDDDTTGDGSGADNNPPPLTGWESLGTVGQANYLNAPYAMTIDSNGNPLVAWQNESNEVRVDRWSSVDSTWQQVGEALSGAKPALALDSNDQPLLVYWKAPEGEDYRTAYAVQWNGVSWDQLGGDDAIVDRSNAYGFDVFADVQFDNLGAPVIALPKVYFEEGKPYLQHNQIIVMRWKDDVWQAVGTSPQVNTAEGVHRASLANGGNGRLVLAWSELPQDVNGYTYEQSKAFVADWNGASWTPLGDGQATPLLANEGSQVRALHVALESDGTPIIAWQSTAVWGVNGPTYLRRWDGTEWLAYAERLSDAWSPVLLLDSSDRPLIASDDLAIDRKVSLRRWDTTTWTTLETKLTGEKAMMASSSTGTVYVGVLDSSSLNVYRLP